MDVLGDAGPLQYREATEACINDTSVDGLLVILTPQAMTNPTTIAKEIVSLQNRHNKTILASWMGEEDVRGGVNTLKKGNIEFPASATAPANPPIPAIEGITPPTAAPKVAPLATSVTKSPTSPLVNSASDLPKACADRPFALLGSGFQGKVF